MKARVTVTLKSGILDPQGKAIEGALKSLGVAGIASVRQGKVFDIEIAATDRKQAQIALKQAALDLPDELPGWSQAFGRHREGVGDAGGSRGGLEGRLQDVAVADVLACRLELGVGGELEGSATPCVEQACEHGLAVEARRCKPVDRAVTCNERARPPVANRRVILDRNIVVSVAHARIRSQGDRV